MVTGCLFFWPLLGLDPLPGRWPYPARALLMVLSVPFHTVLGLTDHAEHDAARRRLVPELRPDLGGPVDDQNVAGGILWAGGEIVSVTMLGVLVFQWIRDVGAGGPAHRPRAGPRRGRASARSSRRADRQLGGGTSQGLRPRVRSAGTTTCGDHGDA